MKTQSNLRSLLLAGIVVATQTGCYRFTIKTSAQPASQVLVDKLHSSVTGEVYVIDKPYELDLLCPQGWASIERHESVLDWLINAATPFWYYADTVTLTCATAAETQLPPLLLPPPPLVATPPN